MSLAHKGGISQPVLSLEPGINEVPTEIAT